MPPQDHANAAGFSERQQSRFAAHEREEIEKRLPISTSAFFEVIRNAGALELSRPTAALLASGLAAGLAIGFSVLSRGLLQSHLPEADWRPLIASIGYTVGFVIVIMGQMQLFTENTITVVCPALERPCAHVFTGVARLWSAVLFSNLVGASLFGVALFLTREMQPEVWRAILEMSRHATSHGWLETLLRGIGAGWLIAAMVWIMATAEGIKLPIVMLVVYVIALADFSHVVAGATEAAALVAAGEASLVDATVFVAAALVGNIVGGTVLFTMLTWAQIWAERSRRRD